LEAGFICSSNFTAVCTPVCGDGLIVGTEANIGGCDDNNTLNDDGCSSTCTLEARY